MIEFKTLLIVATLPKKGDQYAILMLFFFCILFFYTTTMYPTIKTSIIFR